MPNHTVNFNLPYPNGGDDPCLFAEQWCEFTDAVQAIFDRFQATIDRTVPAIPAAQLRRDSTAFYNLNPTYIGWNLVSFDTAGWVQVSATDPVFIIPDRASVMSSTANVQEAPDGVNSIWFLAISVLAAFQGSANYILDRGVAGQIVGNHLYWQYALTRSQGFSVTVSGLQATTIYGGFFTVYWHADHVRPS